METGLLVFALNNILKLPPSGGRQIRRRTLKTIGMPVGGNLELERQREKDAFVRQNDALDGRNVRKIASAAETPDEDRVLRVAAYCRVSTDDIDQIRWYISKTFAGARCSLRDCKEDSSNESGDVSPSPYSSL